MADTPNILWLMDDQHKYNLLSCLGGPMGLTPHLDALAGDGVLFENAYTPSPVCGPARACLKTGRFPPAHGEIDNWVKLRNGTNAYLPALLRGAGYETAMAGKLHLSPQGADYGFEKSWISDAPYSVYAQEDKTSDYIAWLRKRFFARRGVDPVKLFDADELCYDTDLRRFMMGSGFRIKEEHDISWTTQRTVDFLRTRDRTRPFFFYASFFGPHQPYLAPAPYASFCSPDEIRLPASYDDARRPRGPVFEGNARETAEHIGKSLTREDAKALIAANYGQIHMLDEAIGTILAELRQAGLYENTWIVFTSDHGDHLGEHGLFFKGQMYDSCAKVPLILKPAGNFAACRCQQTVSTIDLYATLLDAADAAPAVPDQEGESRSLMPLLRGRCAAWPDSAYSIIGRDPNRALCMLRRKDFKIMRLAKGGKNDAVYEMYDLAHDPQERADLFGNPDFARRQAELQADLDGWFARQYARYPR